MSEPVFPARAATPVPRDDPAWHARHELLRARARSTRPELVFLGDSITQGWEEAGRATFERTFGPRALALGINGDHTQHLLWRLEHGLLDGLSPRDAVVLIGTNNSVEDGPEGIAAGVAAIVAHLRRNHPDTRVLLLALFPRGQSRDDPRRAINAAASALYSRLADGTNVRYADIGAAFLREDGTVSPEAMPDFLHLSSDGYDRWATELGPLVNPPG